MSSRALRFASCILLVILSLPLLAQQTGTVSGRVTSTDGAGLPGVMVEARSPSLPQPRTTYTSAIGEYRMPALQPGVYTITFTLAGMQTVTRKTDVLLAQDASVDVSLGVAGVAESITVTAESSLVDRSSAEISSAMSNEQIQALPVAQEYRDLQKLIPGVQLTQDAVRGPSAGGSGQDNVYLFDGVNVTMPLFGVLVAEPATHDIAQFSVTKGGARAVDFERSGGFSIDSVSKSGTNKFAGQLSYQVLNNSFISSQKGTVNSRFNQDRTWTTVNVGGPVVPDRLFFYTSYYRPIFSRDNQANFYGDLPSYESIRNEYFGKLTLTPTASWLVNGSYRTSKRTEQGDTFAATSAPTTGFGYETNLKIATLESSWIVSPSSFAEFKFTDFRNPGGGTPANFVSDPISLTTGSRLNINNLDRLGRLSVPTPIGTNAAQSAFVQPYIDKYGYINSSGVRTGGGSVGYASLSADDDDFFRKSGQVGFNYQLGNHDLHFGYQRTQDEEDRFQTSNGYGNISIPAGTVNCPASACGAIKPAFFQAILSQQTTGVVPAIHAEVHSQSFEINDAIHLNNWTFNVGVLASNDALYGQGLKKADNIAGFVSAPGVKYKMYEVSFADQIQPRLSANWAYNGSDSVFASYARYNPAVGSLARAASWDRNLISDVNAYFDADGTLMGIDPVNSSSGKLFVEDLAPRHTDEFMVGTGQQIASNWSARAYGRYRYSTNFWEDTNNTARIAFGQGVPGVLQELYIPDLAARRTAIGSGSSYVIAELDGAFTKYYEGTAETDWRHNNTFLRGSYTLSHYYGNFDQDNTTFNTNNDQSTFIGSSNIGDGAGRQIWNNKYGDLRGDRRHVAKLIGTQTLPWKATVGAIGIFQAGQPYQLESFLPYKSLTTSTSDTNRYAEPAGRRKSPSHHQVDLNYTQNFGIPWGMNVQFLFDIFNIYNKQTGYNYETRVGTLGTQALVNGQCTGFTTGLEGDLACLRQAPYAKSFYDPRRVQLALRLQF